MSEGSRGLLGVYKKNVAVRINQRIYETDDEDAASDANFVRQEGDTPVLEGQYMASE